MYRNEDGWHVSYPLDEATAQREAAFYYDRMGYEAYAVSMPVRASREVEADARLADDADMIAAVDSLVAQVKVHGHVYKNLGVPWVSCEECVGVARLVIRWAQLKAAQESEGALLDARESSYMYGFRAAQEMADARLAELEAELRSYEDGLYDCDGCGLTILGEPAFVGVFNDVGIHEPILCKHCDAASTEADARMERAMQSAPIAAPAEGGAR